MKDGKELTYDKVNELKYLECCVNETLRKYPPLPMLNRVCLNDYKVKGTDYTIKKGSNVIIPIFGMQRDSDLIENPLQFIPERFMPGSLCSNQDMLNAPFGIGQRACIGSRMAIVVIKTVIAHLLLKYDFQLISPTNEIKFSVKIPSLTPNEPLLMKFVAR
jgi:cytochrome P450 family 6